MVQIAIVEDEKKQIDLLESYLKKYKEEQLQNIVWHAFLDGDEFLISFTEGKYDIVLLDIQMGHVNGMQVASEIRKLDDTVLIIFITNLVQYAIQGYSVRALDFIVKPVEYELFSQRMQGAINRLQRTMQGTLSFKIVDGIVNLHPSRILYFGIEAKKLYIYTDTQVYRCNDTLQNIENRLSGNRFFRCHAGYLVNMAHVHAIKRDCALVGDTYIPISKYRRKEFLYAVGNFLGSEM